MIVKVNQQLTPLNRAPTYKDSRLPRQAIIAPKKQMSQITHLLGARDITETHSWPLGMFMLRFSMVMESL